MTLRQQGSPKQSGHEGGSAERDVVGWGKVLGCIASVIGVELCEPGHVRRGAGRGGKEHTVFHTSLASFSDFLATNK